MCDCSGLHADVNLCVERPLIELNILQREISAAKCQLDMLLVRMYLNLSEYVGMYVSSLITVRYLNNYGCEICT